MHLEFIIFSNSLSYMNTKIRLYMCTAYCINTVCIISKLVIENNASRKNAPVGRAILLILLRAARALKASTLTYCLVLNCLPQEDPSGQTDRQTDTQWGWHAGVSPLRLMLFLSGQTNWVGFVADWRVPQFPLTPKCVFLWRSASINGG